jgi:hypothetical protein
MGQFAHQDERRAVMNRLRRHVSRNAVASLALFIALGGTGVEGERQV